jgi:hypothetical protein
MSMRENIGFEHLPGDSEKYIGHPSHAKPGIHVYPDKLYVVTVVEDPLRWRSRYRNYWKFESECQKGGAILYTVELAFGGRAFEVTEANNPRHLQLRGHDEILHKENALSLGIARLPVEAKYIATLDADIQFSRPDWAQETLHLLQHYKVLQMFSHSMDLGPENQPLNIHEGFVMHELAHAPHNPVPMGENHSTKCPRHPHNNHEHHRHRKNCKCPPCPPGCKQVKCPPGCEPICPCPDPYYYMEKGKYVLWHPGLAWAWRKTALNQLGGLMDWVMGGSADHYMALALFNKIERTNLNLKEFPDGYRKPCMEWQARAERHIRRNVGYMPGTVSHSWHGPKEKRQYLSRAAFLAKMQFDPMHDLKRDFQGLWQLHDHGDLRSIQIRDGLRHFARLRDEDSMSLDGDR